jgi:hypothetical protein
LRIASVDLPPSLTPNRRPVNRLRRGAGTVNAMRSTPTWPVAAGSLVLGFAVAQATGIRPLGGIVLLAGAGWCALRWREKVGVGRAAGLVGLYLAAFVASHLLADPIGAWPSVAVVAAVVAAGSYAVADAAPARRAVGV